jgi:hypothetical protein
VVYLALVVLRACPRHVTWDYQAASGYLTGAERLSAPKSQFSSDSAGHGLTNRVSNTSASAGERLGLTLASHTAAGRQSSDQFLTRRGRHADVCRNGPGFLPSDGEDHARTRRGRQQGAGPAHERETISRETFGTTASRLRVISTNLCRVSQGTRCDRLRVRTGHGGALIRGLSGGIPT